jgi:hypothetical protein
LSLGLRQGAAQERHASSYGSRQRGIGLSNIVYLAENLHAGETVIRQHRGQFGLFRAHLLDPLAGLLLEALFRVYRFRSTPGPPGQRVCGAGSVPQGRRPTDAKGRRTGRQDYPDQDERISPLHDQLS